MSRFERALALSVLALAGLSIALVAAVIIFRGRKTNSIELPGFTVEVVYPGATASEIEQKIAAPIEQQLNGVEHLRRLRSRSWGDGSYFLDVALDRGVDLNVAQILIQNRVALALPVLPAQVQGLGVTVRKRPDGLVMIIGVRSSDSSFDDTSLGFFTNIYVKGELARLPGVADVVILGKQDLAMRIWLDPQMLIFRKLSAAEVARALERQTAEASSATQAGPGDHPQLPADAPGTSAWRAQLEETVIKTDPDGSVVRLRDVARKLDFGVGPRGFASFDGKPVVALAVYLLPKARPSDVSAAVETKLADLRHELFPPGLDAVVGFDLSQPAKQKTSGYLLLDLDLPEGTSPERAADCLRLCQEFLQTRPEVGNVLVLSEQPFDRDRNQPCLVVSLNAPDGAAVDRARLTRDIRAGLVTPAGPAAAIGVRDLAAPDQFQQLGYPIEFAVCGPDHIRAHELAKQLVERMSQDRRLTGVRSAAPTSPHVSVEIDRAKAEALGLPYADVSTAVQTVSGFVQAAGTIQLFGRIVPVIVHIEPMQQTHPDALNQIRVRNNNGEMIPLRAVATVRSNAEPKSLERVDLFAARSITAEPATGLSLAECRFLCEHLAAEVLPSRQPGDYRLVWLREMPAARAPAASRAP
jgi:multidrug efflux pump subunit AcrB